MKLSSIIHKEISKRSQELIIIASLSEFDRVVSDYFRKRRNILNAGIYWREERNESL